MSYFLTSGLLFGLLLISEFALACSCRVWQNAQQASQNPDTIIAQVETVLARDDGSAKLKVHQVFKGELSNRTIEVQGQDGVNCNGEIVRNLNRQWIVLITGGGKSYETLSCADTALPINPETNKVEFSINSNSGSIELSEIEFKKLIRLQIIPTISGLVCYVYARRTYVERDAFERHPLDFQFNETFDSKDSRSLAISADLSEYSRVGTLELAANLERKNPLEYVMNIELTEPFFSEKITISSEINMGRTYLAESLSFTKFTDLNGDDLDDPNARPFLGHEAFAECSVKASFPLIEVQD